MKGIISSLIHLIYPNKCPICGEILEKDSILCKSCLSGLKKLSPPFCPICSVPFPDGESHICEACLRRRPYFESISSAYIYEGTASKAIHLFKFQRKKSVGRAIGMLLSEFASNWWKGISKKDIEYVVVPVPLGKRRLRERGFNQSLTIARYVSKGLNLAIDYLSLRRIKETEQQSVLGTEERKRNVRNAFEVFGDALKGKGIILVDDVATTGSTLNECAKALRRAGVEEIRCLVFSRTSYF